jgi:hypothetical protein
MAVAPCDRHRQIVNPPIIESQAQCSQPIYSADYQRKIVSACTLFAYYLDRGRSVSRRLEIKNLARQYSLPLDQARRIYLDEPSFAIGTKKSVEFEIKSQIAGYFNVPFRFVVFCGSAHLGFSPHKDTEFQPGLSDLDVALVSMEAFQSAWMSLVEATRAFTDLSGFRRNPNQTVEDIRTTLAKRGLLHLNQMPICQRFDKDRAFLDSLSRSHRSMFGSIGISFYMNEYAFCWKQNSAIRHILV